MSRFEAVGAGGGDHICKYLESWDLFDKSVYPGRQVLEGATDGTIFSVATAV